MDKAIMMIQNVLNDYRERQDLSVKDKELVSIIEADLAKSLKGIIQERKERINLVLHNLEQYQDTKIKQFYQNIKRILEDL